MKYTIMAVLLFVVAAGYMFMSNRPTPAGFIPTDVSDVAPTENLAIDTKVDTAMVIQVEAGSFYYTPDTITVQKGQPVKIVMTSVDTMHDFVIDELNLAMPIIQNGDVGEVEFTPDTVGEFTYYCSVGQHRANGQVGTLIVTE